MSPSLWATAVATAGGYWFRQRRLEAKGGRERWGQRHPCLAALTCVRIGTVPTPLPLGFIAPCLPTARVSRRHGIEVLLPSVALRMGLQQVGERLTGEWLMRSTAEGLATIEAYRKLTP
jgi:hypothetical protein